MFRVIFEHHPKAGQEDLFIKQWQIGSDIIQTYPGARGTKLFRDLDNPLVLYAVADWDSKIDRDKAMAAVAERPDAKEVLRGHEKFLNSYITLVSAELIASSPPESA